MTETRVHVVGIQLRLHPKEKYVPVSSEYTVIENEYPCYYKISSYVYKGTKYISVLYQIYYTFNGAIGLNGLMPTNENLGAHEKDVERVVILHDVDTKAPVWLFVSGHAQEGSWHKFDECEFAPENRVVIYAALGSHRHSITPGVKWRILGFANDYCSRNGKHLNLTLHENNSIGFTIYNKELLDTTFRAFFYPLFALRLDVWKAQQQVEESRMNP
jgi:hypothetical protein